MSIPDIWEKIKTFLEKDEFIHGIMVFIIILVGLAGFGLGKLSRDEFVPVKIMYEPTVQNKGGKETTPTPHNAQSIFGSKNGTKYYFSWCRGAGNVKDENKVLFSSEADAIAAGYAKASGCN